MPPLTCRTCAYYRRANVAPQLPTHGSCTAGCTVAGSIHAIHANTRACPQYRAATEVRARP